jgi:exopolysaccharide production protein ExoZ
MNRIHNLDYLRGLAAFSIMIYHYMSWTYGDFTSDTILGRLGIYGVSIFYVLSGLTLSVVYLDKMALTKKDLGKFYLKRILRIFPLLWMATILTTVVLRDFSDIQKIILNLSGLFGFVAWEKYIATGAWSIGNELVFYMFFPVFIYLTKFHKGLMIILSLSLFFIALYFSFFVLDPKNGLSIQWKNYVNPLNQVFLFLGGFLIAMFLKNRNVNNLFLVMSLVISTLFFVLYPASGDTISLVTGTNRLLFSAICFLICFCVFKLHFQFPKVIHKPLTLIGEASYSLYLLHPIIWKITSFFLNLVNERFFKLPQEYNILFSILLTIVVSNWSYEYFEKYFLHFGKKVKSQY